MVDGGVAINNAHRFTTAQQWDLFFFAVILPLSLRLKWCSILHGIEIRYRETWLFICLTVNCQSAKQCETSKRLWYNDNDNVAPD